MVAPLGRGGGGRWPGRCSDLPRVAQLSVGEQTRGLTITGKTQTLLPVAQWAPVLIPEPSQTEPPSLSPKPALQGSARNLELPHLPTLCFSPVWDSFLCICPSSAVKILSTVQDRIQRPPRPGSLPCSPQLSVMRPPRIFI